MSKFSREEIKKIVIECVAESLAVEGEITEKSNLVTDYDADSLDIMDMMFLFEDKFEIKLDKEDFNFLQKIDMSREEAVVDSFLTPAAKKELQKWLPSLDMDKELKPADLGGYLTVEALIIVMESFLEKSGAGE